MRVFQLRSAGKLLLSSLVLLVCAAGLSAATIGTFGTEGGGVLTYTSTGGIAFIDFCPVDPSAPNPGCGVADTGTGNIDAKNGTGIFDILVPDNPGFSVGTIRDIKNMPGGDPSYVFFPPDTFNPVNNFLTVSSLSNLNFQAQVMTAAGCDGTVIIGPFCFTDIGNSVFVGTTFRGVVLNTMTNALVGNFEYSVSGQFTAADIPALLAAAGTPGGPGAFSNTFSGEVVVSAIPEPGTYALMGAGLVGLGLLRRRFNK